MASKVVLAMQAQVELEAQHGFSHVLSLPRLSLYAGWPLLISPTDAVEHRVKGTWQKIQGKRYKAKGAGQWTDH